MERLTNKLLDRSRSEGITPPLTHEQARYLASLLLSWISPDEKLILERLKYNENRIVDNDYIGETKQQNRSDTDPPKDGS